MKCAEGLIIFDKKAPFSDAYFANLSGEVHIAVFWEHMRNVNLKMFFPGRAFFCQLFNRPAWIAALQFEYFFMFDDLCERDKEPLPLKGPIVITLAELSLDDKALYSHPLYYFGDLCFRVEDPRPLPPQPQNTYWATGEFKMQKVLYAATDPGKWAPLCPVPTCGAIKGLEWVNCVSCGFVYPQICVKDLVMPYIPEAEVIGESSKDRRFVPLLVPITKLMGRLREESESYEKRKAAKRPLETNEQFSLFSDPVG